MKLLLIILLLCLSISIFAQRPTVKETISLFKKTPTEIKSFLTQKGFKYKGKDEELDTYELPQWGDVCDITIGYKASKLNAFSITQSVMYYNLTLNNLIQDSSFKLTKAFPGSIDDIPVPGPGNMYRYDNKKAHIICSIVFPIDSDNSFTTTYAKLH